MNRDLGLFNIYFDGNKEDIQKISEKNFFHTFDKVEAHRKKKKEREENKNKTPPISFKAEIKKSYAYYRTEELGGRNKLEKIKGSVGKINCKVKFSPMSLLSFIYRRVDDPYKNQINILKEFQNFLNDNLLSVEESTLIKVNTIKLNVALIEVLFKINTSKNIKDSENISREKIKRLEADILDCEKKIKDLTRDIKKTIITYIIRLHNIRFQVSTSLYYNGVINKKSYKESISVLTEVLKQKIKKDIEKLDELLFISEKILSYIEQNKEIPKNIEIKENQPVCVSLENLLVLLDNKENNVEKKEKKQVCETINFFVKNVDDKNEKISFETVVGYKQKLMDIFQVLLKISEANISTGVELGSLSLEFKNYLLQIKKEENLFYSRKRFSNTFMNFIKGICNVGFVLEFVRPLEKKAKTEVSLTMDWKTSPFDIVVNTNNLFYKYYLMQKKIFINSLFLKELLGQKKLLIEQIKIKTKEKKILLDLLELQKNSYNNMLKVQKHIDEETKNNHLIKIIRTQEKIATLSCETRHLFFTISIICTIPRENAN